MSEGLLTLEGIEGLPLISFLLFVFPGFVAVRTYGLFNPLGDRTAKDLLVDIAAYGTANAAIIYLPMRWAFADGVSIVTQWLTLIVSLLFIPAALGFGFFRLQKTLSKRGWIISPHQTPWDDFFLRNESCWVIVHLVDGRRIGGKYFERSRASLHPQPGHLYIEEFWVLNEKGAFERPVERSKGILLRPSDYAFVEFLATLDDDDEA